MPLYRAGVVTLCLSLSGAAVGAAGGAAPPQKNWSSIRSKNFYVIGDASDRNLRSVAARMEQFREGNNILD